MAYRPRAIPITTLRAVAAAQAVGFTYWGGTGILLAAVDDRQFYHFIKVRTSKGVAQTAHCCRSERDRLATLLAGTAQSLAYAEKCAPHRAPEQSREYTRTELALVNPSWLCDLDDAFIEVPSVDNIMATAGLFTESNDDE